MGMAAAGVALLVPAGFLIHRLALGGWNRLWAALAALLLIYAVDLLQAAWRGASPYTMHPHFFFPPTW